MASRSIDQRKAESVLPEPVGATTSACRPAAMASHAPVWAVVGAAKAAVNQARVGAEKSDRSNCCTPSSFQPPLTDPDERRRTGSALVADAGPGRY